MHRRIDDVEFTIFDTETTGLDPGAGDRIVEIAALRCRGSEKIAEFQALVDPQREISPGAFAQNKITPEMLRGAKRIDGVMPDFLRFIQGSCLCAYNAAFDLEFVDSELHRMGQGPLEDFVVVDILKMARKLLPSRERYALWFVAKELGIGTEQIHRARADVELTWEVFKRLNEILAHKGILDFAALSHLSAINTRLLENVHAQKIAQIQEALDLGVMIKIRYLSGSGIDVTERQVIPTRIKQEGGIAYMVGQCLLRNQERTFRVDGILHIEIV